MSELEQSIKDLEKSKKTLGKKQIPLLPIVAGIVVVIVVVVGVLVWLGLGSVDAFPEEGSHVCKVDGINYYVLDGSYFHVENDELVAVSNGYKIVGTIAGDWIVNQTDENYFQSAPSGTKCSKSEEPRTIIGASTETRVISIGERSYSVEGFGPLPEQWHEGPDLD